TMKHDLIPLLMIDQAGKPKSNSFSLDLKGIEQPLHKPFFYLQVQTVNLNKMHRAYSPLKIHSMLLVIPIDEGCDPLVPCQIQHSHSYLVYFHQKVNEKIHQTLLFQLYMHLIIALPW